MARGRRVFCAERVEENAKGKGVQCPSFFGRSPLLIDLQPLLPRVHRRCSLSTLRALVERCRGKAGHGVAQCSACAAQRTRV